MRTALSIPQGAIATPFVDLQEEHRRDRRFLVEGYDGVLERARGLQDAARANAAPVFHAAYVRCFQTQPPRPFEPVGEAGDPYFSGVATGEMTAICDEVAPRVGEAVFVKQDASAFSEPCLAPTLSAAGVEWLLIAGVWTEACVAATVRDAIAAGLRVLLVKDACGSGAEAMHQTALIHLANRLYGGAVISAADAVRALAGESVEAWRLQGAAPLRFDYQTAGRIYAEL